MSYRPTMTIEPKEPIDAKLAVAYRDTMSRPDKRPHRKISVSIRLSLAVLDLLDEGLRAFENVEDYYRR